MKRKFKLGMAVCLMAAFVFTGCKKDSDDKYSVTLSANNAEWGTVAGGGDYADGTEISIMATANSGYHFEKWSDDDTNNPRTLTVTKNIALIAVFAEGNGGGIVNGGNSGNNNSGNNGTATGDILPKKVIKIIEKDANDVTTYLFDTQGRIISETETYKGEVESVKNYTYSDNTIVRKSSSKTVFNVENGRIVSDVLEDGDGEYIYPSEYTYTSDGYLVSYITTSKLSKDFIDESKFSIIDGNIIENQHHYVDTYEDRNSKTTVVFGDKLNNLNIDVTLFLIDYDLHPLTGYYGKRNKNLPSSCSEVHTEYTYIEQFTYTYDGDYLTKITSVWSETSGSESYTGEITYEFFYE